MGWVKALALVLDLRPWELLCSLITEKERALGRGTPLAHVPGTMHYVRAGDAARDKLIMGTQSPFWKAPSPRGWSVF